jgi:hypothetical protein
MSYINATSNILTTVYKNSDGRLYKKVWFEGNQEFCACEFRGVVGGKYKEIQWTHVPLLADNGINVYLQGLRNDGVSDEWSMMDVEIVEED